MRTPSVSGTLAAVATALALAVSGTLAGSPAAAAPASPGGRSSGDSLFPRIGNTGYDVRHYGIRIGYRPSTGRIDATTTISATARRRLSSYSLDLEGLTVRRVTVDGHRARWSRHGHKLVVRPTRVVSGRFTTRVHYDGRPRTHVDPDGAADGWIPTQDGGATTLNEPVGAMTWFPNNNTPRDKATFTVSVTAPKAYAVAGNGELASKRTRSGRTTWRWRAGHQMTTYLSMISIGKYDVHRTSMTTTTGRTLPVWSFVKPSYGSLATQRALVPEVVRFHEQRFGRYPFDSVGMVVQDLDVGYALETQTRPVYDGVPDEATIVHELAHQWYGDSVTLGDWQDIWLNEGFATYAEDLWDAEHGGPSTATAFRLRYEANPSTSDLWSPAPARFSDPADLFGEPVYKRGGMALEALRQRIGDDAFFTVLRRWATAHREGTVRTGQLRALAEQVSGQDLGTLFEDWLYLAERPTGY